MKKRTRNRKNSSNFLNQVVNDENITFANMTLDLINEGKMEFNKLLLSIGIRFVESILYLEREQKSGPDYFPSQKGNYKWASQPGSAYIMGQKVPIEKPRLRGPQGEITLDSYQAFRDNNAFGEDVMVKILNGISERKYQETLIGMGEEFGVSPSSISRRVVEVSTRKMEEFLNRDLSDFRPFSIFIDGYGIENSVFIVAMGIDLGGNKRILGFCEGATENSEVCKALLDDLANRGLVFSKKVIYVTDGGPGIIKALKDRHGKKLLHQRCSIHKLRNIIGHLPKKYSRMATKMFNNAITMVSYKDAKEEMMKLLKWLSERNESAANSLEEALEELLLVHRLGITGLLRKSLYTTNIIESAFSMVTDTEKNVKKYKGTKMAQRRLATALIFNEKRFRRIKGYAEIKDALQKIEIYLNSID